MEQQQELPQLQRQERQQPQHVLPAMTRCMLILAFKPPVFDGLIPDLAGKWLINFNRDTDLVGLVGLDKCRVMGLLLSGYSETWFNNLPQTTRHNFEHLQHAFIRTFVNADHTRIYRQMASLSRIQQPRESVDVYITEARAMMMEHNYDDDLQMTLLLNGLRPDIKGLVIQHLPFPNLRGFVHKCRHVEASLQISKFDSHLSNGTYTSVVKSSPDTHVVTVNDIEKLGYALNSLVTRIDNLERKVNACHSRWFDCGATSKGYIKGTWNESQASNLQSHIDSKTE